MNYQEADSRAGRLATHRDERAEAHLPRLPENARDAFFELVLYPTKACALVNELYIAAAKNRLYASQGRASANDYAARDASCFRPMRTWSATYNHTLADGKWDHMMDQTHIGYTVLAGAAHQQHAGSH